MSNGVSQSTLRRNLKLEVLDLDFPNQGLDFSIRFKFYKKAGHSWSLNNCQVKPNGLVLSGIDKTN